MTDAPVARGDRRLGRVLALFAVLVAAGLAGNALSLEIIFGVQFLFGTIFALLAFQWLGAGWGVAAGFLISLSTYPLWNHPYAVVIMTGETAFVALLCRRRGAALVVADALYWLVLGIPLVFAFYFGVMRLTVDTVTFTALKQALNGITNAVLARLAFTVLTTLTATRARRQKHPLSELVFNLLTLFVLAPSLLLLATQSRRDLADTEVDACNSLAASAQDAARHLTECLTAGTPAAGYLAGELAVHLRTEELRGLRYWVLSRDDRIVAAGGAALAPLPIPRARRGELRSFRAGVALWLPPERKNVPISDRWRRGFYVAERPIAGPAGWRLVLEQPIAPFQERLYRKYTAQLGLVFGVLLGAVLAARLLSARLTSTLSSLVRVSHDLPRKLLAAEKLAWPSSGIAETASLIDHFRSMAGELERHIREIQAMNAGLEERVAERTRQLETSEARYRLLAENTSDVVWQLDLAAERFTYVSPSVFLLRGYTPEEVLAQPLDASLTPASARDLRAQIVRSVAAFAHGRTDPREELGRLEQPRKDGTTVWTEVSLTYVLDQASRPVGIVGISRDVTERLRVEQERRQASERLLLEREIIAQLSVSRPYSEGDVNAAARQLTESVAKAFGVERVGVWLFNPDETELSCVDLYELTPAAHSSGAVLREHEFREEFQALKSARYVDASDALSDPRVRGYREGYLKPNRITAMLDGVITTGGRNLGTVCFEHVDRPHLWQTDEIAFNCQVADQIGMAVLNRERREAERALREKTRELEDLTANLERRVEEEFAARRRNEQLLIQQSRLAALGEMLGAIGHQWRQPLNTLGLCVQNIRDAFRCGDLDARLLETTTEKALAQIRHMSRTIDDFRNFFVPDRAPSVFDAMSTTAEALVLFSGQLGASDVDYRFSCRTHGTRATSVGELVPCPGKKVRGGRNEFGHVVLNLVSNARDAIAEKRRRGGFGPGGRGLVALEFESGERTVVLRVSDNGGGIPPELLGRVFELYFTTKEPTKGTGIGLYMSKLIVEGRLGGTLLAENRGDGALFTVELPAADAEDEGEHRDVSQDV